MEIRGGSIRRVFARAKLALSVIDQPELLVPPRDQVHLLEYAYREIGDELSATARGLLSAPRQLADRRIFAVHATTLLEQGMMQITQVGLQLGSADPSISSAPSGVGPNRRQANSVAVWASRTAARRRSEARKRVDRPPRMRTTAG